MTKMAEIEMTIKVLQGSYGANFCAIHSEVLFHLAERYKDFTGKETDKKTRIAIAEMVNDLCIKYLALTKTIQ